MEDLQIFSFEENDVRTLSINDTPYFVGKDVAKVLGYKRTADAIHAHVDFEDKGVGEIQTPGGLQKMMIINESGLYALIFGSRLESAKRFKRWVTSEVLPAIRKTGKYEAPKDPMEIMRLQFEALDQTNKKVDTIEKDVTYLKDEVKLDAGEYNFIAKHVRRNVMEIIQRFGFADTQEVKQALFKDINSGLNEVCGIKTRTQLRQKHFNKAMDYINVWVPSTATRLKVQQLTLEFADDQEGGQANL
ncbi:BRO family protein [Salinicoccus roseus]|uniref:BRO family protein n=1 Tax=Salinicoccus roseus TaxID=45670 RepID=UPI003525AA5C